MKTTVKQRLSPQSKKRHSHLDKDTQIFPSQSCSVIVAAVRLFFVSFSSFWRFTRPLNSFLSILLFSFHFISYRHRHMYLALSPSYLIFCSFFSFSPTHSISHSSILSSRSISISFFHIGHSSQHWRLYQKMSIILNARAKKANRPSRPFFPPSCRENRRGHKSSIHWEELPSSLSNM